MPLTYSYGADLAGSATDRLRWLVQDTASPWLMANEELAASYTLAGSGIYTAAAAVCRALAARFAVQVDTAAEGVSSRKSQRADAFAKLAERYQLRAIQAGEPAAGTTAGASLSGAPVATGISVGDIIANDRDRDRPPSHFGTAIDGPGYRGGPYGFRGWW